MENKKQFYFSMGILVMLFFIFGLVSWVNTILIPYFRLTCQLSIVQSYFVTFAFFIAYLVMSIPASILLNKVGYKRGITIGLWIMSIGALLFVPAAYFRTFDIFLSGLFSLGIGLAILQSAANPYVSIIGPIESAAKRLSIVGIGNKFAGIVANLVFAAVVISESDKGVMEQIKQGTFSGAELEMALDGLIRGVMMPYGILSALLFFFGIVVYFSPLPDIDASKANAKSANVVDGRTSILQHPWLVLGVLALFFHVGSQMIGLAPLISYAESMGLTLDQAKNFPSYTMGFTMLGYLLGIILIPRILSQQTMLILATSLGLLFSLLAIYVQTPVTILGLETRMSIWFLVLLGLPNAMIYAGIWPLAIKGLGRFTNLGSATLVMALCGSAIMPLVYGIFQNMYGSITAYWVLVPCFVYMIFFATIGYKIEKWKK